MYCITHLNLSLDQPIWTLQVVYPQLLDGQLTWSEDGTHDEEVPTRVGPNDSQHVWIFCWPWAWSTILVSLLSLILAADLEVWNSLRTNLSKHLGIELETSRGAAVRCHCIIEKSFPQTRNNKISCFCSFCHGFIFLDSGLGAVQWGFLRYFHVFCFEREKFSARRPRNDAMTRHIAATNRNYSRCETWEFIALRFRSAMTVVTHRRCFVVFAKSWSHPLWHRQQAEHMMNLWVQL